MPINIPFGNYLHLEIYDMNTDNSGILAGIIITLSALTMIFGVLYLYNLEKTAMIALGMAPGVTACSPFRINT